MASLRRFLTRATATASRAIARLAFAILIVGSLSPTGARAGMSKDQAVDWAINAFISAGASYIGITIPPQAVPVLREMVACGVDGGSVADCARQSVVKAALSQIGTPDELKGLITCASGGTKLDDCVKQEGLKQIPEQARPLAECLLGGGAVADCATKVAVGEVVARSPEQVRPLVRCVAESGDVGGCIGKVAIDQLPDGDARNMATCIAQGTRLSDCAAQFAKGQVDEATQQQVKQVIDQIGQLKADTENAMKEMRGSVHNITLVAQGITEGNYGKIVLGGGPEIVKIVVTAVVNYMVPIAAPVAGPVVGALVDLYADGARDVFEAAVAGDASAVAAAIFKVYYGEMIARPCALIPAGEFREATCGNAAAAISAAADGVGDAAGLAYQIARELLKVDPVGGWLANRVDDAWKWVTGARDPSDCISPEQYFANNHFACVGKAASTTGPALSQAMQNSCRLYFRACYDRPAEMCAAMAATAGNLVGKINSGLKNGAEEITAKALGAYLASQEKQLCTLGFADKIDDAINDFQMTQCQPLLKQRIPTNPNACPVKVSVPSGSPYARACINAAAAVGGKARDEMNKHCEAYCNANKQACEPPPPCQDLLGNQFSMTHGAGCPVVGIDDIKRVDSDRWKNIGDLGKHKIPDDFTIGGRHGLGKGGQTAGAFVIGKCKPSYIIDVVGSFGGGTGSWMGLKQTVALTSGFGSCGLGGTSRVTTIRSVDPLRPSTTPKSQSGGSSGTYTVHQGGTPVKRGDRSAKTGTASGGSSGSYLVQPGGVPVRRGGSPAMDALTGDNMMPSSNFRIPDGNRPNLRTGTASGGSSGSYTSRNPQSGGSSGSSTSRNPQSGGSSGSYLSRNPQSGGSSGSSTSRNPQGSSGVSTVQPGGIPGQRSTGGSSGASTVYQGPR